MWREVVGMVTRNMRSIHTSGQPVEDLYLWVDTPIAPLTWVLIQKERHSRLEPRERSP